MNTTAKDVSNLRLNTIFIGVAFFWSVVILALAAWNYWQSYTATVEVARSSANQSYSKDLVYRHWAAIHGGVYAPITPETPPNPYLSDIPERDISTPSGKKLTLINPAYMTRQLHELGKKDFGMMEHITSLKPLRPENAPDEWEKSALQAFERGKKEVSSLEPLGNETYLRFMRPLITEGGCLECHAKLGYRVGDIRGGISVSLPWAPFRAALQSQLLVIILGYGGIWTMGILGLYLGRKRLQNHLSEHQQADEALRESVKAARRLAQKNELIAEIGRIISSTLTIEEVYGRFAEKVREAIPFDQIVVNTVNRQDYTRTARYIDGDLIPGNYIGATFSIVGTRVEHVVRTKSSLVINSKNREDMLKKFPGMLLQFGYQSMLMVPLISKDEVIGVLAVHSDKVDAHSENDLLFAERVGLQIAGAIANAQLFLERKQAEEARQILSERLQRAEKMEALGQLAGGVAHDLNNVLGILTGYSELLLEEIPEGSRSRGHVEKILQSTEKGAAIIQDLLTLARRGVTVSDVINLNSVVSDFIQTPVFEKMKDYHPRVTFRTECDKNLLNIKGSPVHLEKALMNLVSNAAEAISGTGEVTIRTESRYLDKPIMGYDKVKEGDYAVLTVADTGMGIPAENREKIFEPFYTKKTMGRSGTGLGLAIVWGTVKDHNGYIDVQTKVGEGTTFTLYFPVTREELLAPHQKLPIERYMGNGESVLVVDDIAEQRDIASRLLKRLGYEVHLVASGAEAVEYLQENKADILVLDMIMAPGIDGLETYQRVLAINPQQKAILVSGFSETERVKEAQKLGAGAYVKKPYVLEKIGVAIRDELNR